MGGRMQTDLAKVHGLDTLGTKGRTDRGTRAGLTGADNELHHLLNTTSTTFCGLGHSGDSTAETLEGS